MSLIKINIAIFLILILSSLAGCLEDNVVPPFTGELNTTAQMLVYFESQGDFINSNSAPPLIDADEVFANLDNYLLIDIRTSDEFAEGHIQNAINVSIDTLYNFLLSQNPANHPKVIIISSNGQSGAYFATLLKLASMENVYSLKYGMASWNIFFAADWINALGDDAKIFTYSNEDYPKNSFTNLPAVKLEKPGSPIHERINERIKKIILENFINEVQYRKRMVHFATDYLVCYGNTSRLYFARRVGALAELGHPANAVFYRANPAFDLRSVNYLQTLPADKTIFVYGADGQLSASIAAYLRVLGYNSQTLLFGGNQLYYSRMIDDPELIPFAFTINSVHDFPYETGQ